MSAPVRPAAAAAARPPGTPRNPAPPDPARRRLRTPGQLRLAMAVSIAMSLLLGAGALAIGLAQARALAATSERTHQVVSLLDVQAQLAQADATVTNGFLIGGLEPPVLHEEYDAALAASLATLALQTGQAVDPDQRLPAVVAAVGSYAGLIEQARANNRQGFPLAVGYIEEASLLLREQVLPDIDAAVAATADAAAANLNGLRGFAWLGIALAIPLLVLIWIQVWLARRTRRTFSLPFALGTLLLGAAGVVAVISFNVASSQADLVRTDSYRGALALSQVLSLSGQARSDEAFTLIRRGSGAGFEDSYQDSVEAARTQLLRLHSSPDSPAMEQGLQRWRDAHQEIIALDAQGDWDQAVARAVSREPGSASAEYTDFVAAVQAELDILTRRTTAAFQGESTAPVALGWITAGAAVVCAVGSWRGLERRLEEYR